jgi:hypothetical protein
VILTSTFFHQVSVSRLLTVFGTNFIQTAQPTRKKQLISSKVLKNGSNSTILQVYAEICYTLLMKFVFSSFKPQKIDFVRASHIDLLNIKGSIFRNLSPISKCIVV